VHVRFGEERQGDSFDYALSLTPLRVKGRRCYLYRAIDSEGATIDFLLSAFRDADAAKRLFRKALGDRSHPQPRVIFQAARRTTQGYEAIHMIRKGRVRWVAGNDLLQQIRFIDGLFDLAA